MNTLGNFATEIDFCLFVLNNAKFCFNQKIEFSGRGPLGLFALVRFFVTCQLFFLIRLKSLMTDFTLHQRIDKSLDMAGRFPNLWIHQDCCINPDKIIPCLNSSLPKSFLDIVLKFYPQTTITPSPPQAALNF